MAPEYRASKAIPEEPNFACCEKPYLFLFVKQVEVAGPGHML